MPQPQPQPQPQPLPHKRQPSFSHYFLAIIHSSLCNPPPTPFSFLVQPAEIREARIEAFKAEMAALKLAQQQHHGTLT